MKNNSFEYLYIDHLILCDIVSIDLQFKIIVFDKIQNLIKCEKGKKQRQTKIQAFLQAKTADMCFKYQKTVGSEILELFWMYILFE